MKNDKKKLQKVIRLLCTFLLVLLFILCIREFFINHLQKKEINIDYKYSLYVTYTLANKKYATENTTIKEAIDQQEKMIITTLHETVPLLKKNEKEYYADFSNIVNENLVNDIIDYTFAKFNNRGEVITDCTFDKKSKIAIIPKKYIDDSEENRTVMQLQILNRVDKKNVNNTTFPVKIKKIFTKTKTFTQNGLNLDTKISISRYKRSKKILKKNIKIYLNNSNIPLEQNMFSWNSKTGVVDINYPPLLINNVFVKINSNQISNVFITKTKAVSAPGDTFNSKFDREHTLTVSNVNEGALYQKMGNKTRLSASGNDNESIVLGTLSVNSTYHYGDCRGNTTNTSNWGDTPEIKYSFDITGNMLNYDSYCIPFIVNLSELNKVWDGNSAQFFTFSNNPIGLYCMHQGVEATEPDSLTLAVVLVDIDLDADYAILELASMNSVGNQTAHVVFKVIWEDKAASITVTKDYDCSPSDDEKSATISLYNSSNCSGTVIDSGTLNKNSLKISFNNLNVGKTYYVKETFNTNIFGSSDGVTCKAVTTPRTADAYGNYIASTSFRNYKKRYCLKVKKISSKNNDPIKSITFTLDNDNNKKCTTGEDGICTFNDVSSGTHNIRETITSEKYFNDNSSNVQVTAVEQTYNANNHTCSCPSSIQKTFTNNPKYYCVRVKKTDSVTEAALRNATFKIEGSDETVTTGSDGIARFFVGSEPKTSYTVTEVSAPSGYIKDSNFKIVKPILINQSLSEEDARAKCLNTTETELSKIANSSNDAIFTNSKYLLNFKKADGNNSLSGAEFNITYTNELGINQKIGHTFSSDLKDLKIKVKDENGIQKDCYVYSTAGNITSNYSNTTFTADENGEVCITNIPNRVYTVTEIKPAASHTFGSSNPVIENMRPSNVFKSYSNSNTFNNCPTRFEFTKTTSNDSKEEGDSTLKNLTTSQLKKIKWNVYKSTDTNTKLEFVLIDGIYHYSEASDVSGTKIDTLYLNDSRKIVIEHLPVGSYILKESETDDCLTDNNLTCYSNGFYYPDNSVSFEITNNSSSCASSIASATSENEPTKIHLTKSDIYNYASQSQNVKFEDVEEINAFDNIKFQLKDSNGNILKLKRIGTSGNCNSADSYSEYRYIPNSNNMTDLTSDLYTCGGSMYITHLCRDNTYTLEEVSVPDNSVFTMAGNLSVSYTITKNKPSGPSSNTNNIISNVPTRVIIKKVDLDDTNLLINDETTTFNIYKCKTRSCNANDRTLMRFSERGKIQGDLEDNGKEVYKFKLNNEGGVTNLHPYKGELILRYLPKGYYVAVETNAPDGYYNPTYPSNEIKFEVVTNSVDSNDITYEKYNTPTKIYLQKSDIYNYYSNEDKIRIDSDEKILDTVEFVLRNSDGTKLKLKKIDDGIYKYSDDGNIEKIKTYNGSLMITHLTRNKTYYIEEVKTTNEEVLILPKNKTYDNLPFDNKGHPVVIYNISENIQDKIAVTELIENSPTRVAFNKIDSVDNKVIMDETTTFNVYQCSETVTNCTKSNGTLINFSSRGVISGDLEDDGKEVYKYSKLNESGVTDLHPYKGELILRYLPANYKYVLVEIKAPYGYYDPTENINDTTEFIVRDETYDQRSNYELVTDVVRNEPTKIEFTKNDIYSYYNPSDVVRFENNDELRAFDDITFKLTDENGRTLKVNKVLDSGSCTGSNSYSEYRYYENEVEGVELTEELHTCGGNMHITHLYRGLTYKIEEVSVPNNSVFILPSSHPKVTYKIPLSKDKVTKSNSTATISDTPTRIVLFKRDLRTNNLIDDETTTFNIYRCEKSVSICTNLNGTLLHFEEKSKIQNDREDTNKEVYKYKKSNEGGVTDLHPYKGELILRYLPVNYKYVAYEVTAPKGYYNPTDINNKTEFTVDNQNLDVSHNIINDYTKIYLQKKDIYKYYNEEDQGRIDSDEKLLDTVKFIVRDENGNKIKLKKIQNGEYRYIPVNDENSYEEINTYKGSLVVTHLYRNKKYYIEEVKTTNEKVLILPKNKTYSNLPFDNKGHAVVSYNIPINIPDNLDVTQLIENSPTRVVFNKINKTTGEIIVDEKTTFNVYQCNTESSSCTKNNGRLINFTERGFISNDLEDNGKEVYKYSKLNESGVTDLHPYKGELILRYLPAGYKYVLIETNAPDGYYNPTISVDEATEFVVLDESYNSNLNYEILTNNIENTPTKIIFKKSDFYKYYDNTDNKEITSDLKLIDTAKFVLRDENGKILKLKKTDTNDNEENVYRYLEVNDDNTHKYLNTYKGNLIITNLYRNKVYYIEEVETTNPKNFILPENLNYEGLPFDNEGHPVVKYTLSDVLPNSMDSVTMEIENKPTRVRFEKRDSKYNYLIPDETTTFKLYQCALNTECHPTDENDENSTLINFTERSVIENDEEDSIDAEGLRGVEVYKYSKLNKSGVTELHPYHGLLILRYLPSGYDYVLVETVSPLNYTLPSGYDKEVRFTVSSKTTDVKEVDVKNKPTSLIVRKYTDHGELLEGAEFKIYKGLTSCDVNLSAMNQPHGDALGLKTIRDGHYELRPTFDTTVFKTCNDKEGSSCSEINNDLTYVSYQNTFADWQNSTEILDNENKKVEIQKGEALIQYLEYGYCYIIEEVKAPIGYSLPAKKKDRFTMVNITNENTIVDTYKELVNKPTMFTFYKYDDYNNLIDGAEFKLQKLNKDLIYEDIPIIKIKENNKVYYKMDRSSNEYKIETINGSATLYYLEEGQYRIVETKAKEGMELPLKTQNVVTFFVDDEGKVYGSSIIANKPKTEKYKIVPKSSAEFIVNIQTGQKVIKYGIIISIILIIICMLEIIKRKKEN